MNLILNPRLATLPSVSKPMWTVEPRLVLMVIFWLLGGICPQYWLLLIVSLSYSQLFTGRFVEFCPSSCKIFTFLNLPQISNCDIDPRVRPTVSTCIQNLVFPIKEISISTICFSSKTRIRMQEILVGSKDVEGSESQVVCYSVWFQVHI